MVLCTWHSACYVFQVVFVRCSAPARLTVTDSTLSWANGLALNGPSTAKAFEDICGLIHRPLFFPKVAVNFWVSSISESLEHLGICKSAWKPILMYKLYIYIYIFFSLPKSVAAAFEGLYNWKLEKNFFPAFIQLSRCLSLVLVILIVLALHTVQKKVVWSSVIIRRIK